MFSDNTKENVLHSEGLDLTRFQEAEKIPVEWETVRSWITTTFRTILEKIKHESVPVFRIRDRDK